jgi:hypothetical protein
MEPDGNGARLGNKGDHTMLRSRFFRPPILLLSAGGVLLLVLVVTGLLVSGSGFGRHDPIAYSHDPHTLLVQMRAGGGLVTPLDARLDSFPAFTLYGDGTTIYPGGYQYYQGHLDDAAIQRLLSLAMYDAGFFSLPANVGPTVMDAGSITIQITTAAQSRQVSMSSVNDSNDGAVARLRRVSDAIDALHRSADAAYVPPAVLLYSQHEAAPAGSGVDPAIPWPMADVSLEAAYQATWQSGNGLRLTGPNAQAALQTAAQPLPFTQNNQRYLVVAVPTLP